jgi:hypothetical protein
VRGGVGAGEYILPRPLRPTRVDFLPVQMQKRRERAQRRQRPDRSAFLMKFPQWRSHRAAIERKLDLRVSLVPWTSAGEKPASVEVWVVEWAGSSAGPGKVGSHYPGIRPYSGRSLDLGRVSDVLIPGQGNDR